MGKAIFCNFADWRADSQFLIGLARSLFRILTENFELQADAVVACNFAAILAGVAKIIAQLL